MAGNNNQSKKGNQSQKNKGYVSPLKDELELNLIQAGEGVELHYDREADHILMDIDVGTRRGITLSGKSIKIATATYPVPSQGKKKLSVNVFDKDMSMEELEELDEFLEKKAKEKELADKRKALE